MKTKKPVRDIEMKDYVFFLGGHDAEMTAIREVLESNRLEFHDKGLKWGATLSEYKAELESLPPDRVPVLIELVLDMPVPSNAMVIDHHGEQAGLDRPCSLEQVASLLGVDLNRRQRLICANDKGHIRGMAAAGARPDEIQKIRAMDRKAQGVTTADEDMAGTSIRDHLTRINPDTVLVISVTDQTSPVFDRLYDQYPQIFVFTPNGEMTYSGLGDTVKRLKGRFDEARQEDSTLRFWFGGDLPEYGYFGANRQLPTEEIPEMIPKIPFSQHVFLFPFTIDPVSKDRSGKDDAFLTDADTLLTAAGWSRAPFDSTDRELYSENVYFHPFVRQSFFDCGEASSDPVMRYYRRDPGPEGRFRITLKWADSHTQEFELVLHRIGLRIFETRIGILSLEVRNFRYPLLKDVLLINDSGRRIYPQFLDKNEGIDVVKKAFLPEKVEVVTREFTCTEDFDECRFRWSRPGVAEYIKRLLGPGFTESEPKQETGGHRARFRFQPTIDDRMYVICWFGSDRTSAQLRTPQGEDYAYQSDEMWYRFIFHDGRDSGCQHRGMMRRLLQEATYERWVEYGTLYGITRYGLVCITDREPFGVNVIRNHMRRHYATMAAILLAQRASILSFSNEVSRISGEIRHGGIGGGRNGQVPDTREFREVARKVETLHGRIIRFINRLWFTEITPQEQGIEMYEQAVDILHLKEDMQDLRDEMKELYEYVGISYDRRQNEQIRHLTILGALFLPFMVFTGFLGINTAFMEGGLERILERILEGLFGNPQEFSWLLLGLGYGFSIVAFLLVFYICFRLAKGYIRHMEAKSAMDQEPDEKRPSGKRDVTSGLRTDSILDYLTWKTAKEAFRKGGRPRRK